LGLSRSSESVAECELIMSIAASCSINRTTTQSKK
jgi:hypothetical protein